MQLNLAEKLGENGEDFLECTVSGLKAYAAYGYRPEHDDFRPMWANGTDLSGRTYPRTGYYGRENTEFAPARACGDFLLTYVRARRLNGDCALWDAACDMAVGHGLGNPGLAPGRGVNLNMETGSSDPSVLFAVLEMHMTEEHPDYIGLAEAIYMEVMTDTGGHTTEEFCGR